MKQSMKNIIKWAYLIVFNRFAIAYGQFIAALAWIVICSNNPYVNVIVLGISFFTAIMMFAWADESNHQTKGEKLFYKWLNNFCNKMDEECD